MSFSRPPAWFLGAALIAAELVFGFRYPLFRDELYSLACADHLARSYVDQPPLSIWLLWAWRHVFGDSQLAVRVLPAVAGGALVWVTTLLARRLGGGPSAELVAGLLAALAPAVLVMSGFYSMNAWDLLAWAVAALIVAHLVDGGPPRLWLWLGVVVGLGLFNKWSLLFFLAGLAVAALVTPLRRQLALKEPWLGLGLVVLPNLLQLSWQLEHGWPTLEFIENATRFKNAELSLGEFLKGQLIELGPASAPLWLGGLAWLFFARRGAFRALGLIYLVAFGVIAAQHGKPYYLVPAYPPLFAAGAVALESLPSRALRLAVVWLLVALGLPLTPLAIPVLGVEHLVAYSNALGLRPVAEERSALGVLPQHFADRFGWSELAHQVAAIYQRLTPEEQARVVLVGDNYGEAAALDYYGRPLGLPPAISQHNSYYLWGPRREHVDLAIIVGMPAEGLTEAWRECEPKGRLESPWAMPYERRHPILLCRGLLVPLDEAWRRGRHFI